MSLLDLWNSDRPQILEKRFHQLIKFAGEGRLLDGNSTSIELRSLLQAIPSDLLSQWVDEILTDPFDDSGFALQDIVNEVGARLGFVVTPGVYRGRKDGANHDGFWTSPEGDALLVETKTTSAYQIDISKIADYRKQIATLHNILQEEIYVLLVVGRDETGATESQIRGSRHAWSVRLIGIDALIRLVKLKESLNDQSVERQIRSILLPQEFTRLDRIIDLVFETIEDVQDENIDDDTATVDPAARKKPAGFHSEIIPKIERLVGHSLVKRSRVVWSDPEGNRLVSCQVASERTKGPDETLYWFGLKRTTAEMLSSRDGSRSAFGMGSSANVVVLPFDFLQSYLTSCFTSPDEDDRILHWHLRFIREDEKYYLLTNRDRDRVEVSQYLLM